MKKLINILRSYAYKHPFLLQIEICLGFAIIVSILLAFINVIGDIKHNFDVGELTGTFFSSLLVGILAFGILIFPIIVTIYEATAFLIPLIKRKIVIEDKETASISAVGSMLYDFSVIFIGIILEIIVLDLFHSVDFSAQWNIQLSNNQLHTPLNSEYMFTFVVISLLYAAGMFVLTLTKGKKRPPLVTVLCISAMYIGVAETIFFTIHILGMHLTLENGGKVYKTGLDLLYTLLIPINMILIMLRVMYGEIGTYENDKNRQSKIESNSFLKWCNRMLNDSKKWPVIAILMMIPLLGIVIGILTLFGQAPDAAIKAFTETADYTFSTKIPPQNIFYDEHYLCTVAAGGHKAIVKPVRMGKRHGHDVVVNRQLMVANAFEQILEERTPGFHRVVRNFYDKYGFPIAKLIKSKTIADLVWFIMKPLEWVFLIVIYLIDVNPEDRIARQYL